MLIVVPLVVPIVVPLGPDLYDMLDILEPDVCLAFEEFLTGSLAFAAVRSIVLR